MAAKSWQSLLWLFLLCICASTAVHAKRKVNYIATALETAQSSTAVNSTPPCKQEPRPKNCSDVGQPWRDNGKQSHFVVGFAYGSSPRRESCGVCNTHLQVDQLLAAA